MPSRLISIGELRQIGSNYRRRRCRSLCLHDPFHDDLLRAHCACPFAVFAALLSIAALAGGSITLHRHHQRPGEAVFETSGVGN
ncbi:MAG: hypothetical protein VKL23_00130 [Cyanobacteriota bacterium]|nr:hypothetical protein [Cyanobacteriota bacterium]